MEPRASDGESTTVARGKEKKAARQLLRGPIVSPSGAPVQLFTDTERRREKHHAPAREQKRPTTTYGASRQSLYWSRVYAYVCAPPANTRRFCNANATSSA